MAWIMAGTEFFGAEPLSTGLGYIESPSEKSMEKHGSAFRYTGFNLVGLTVRTECWSFC